MKGHDDILDAIVYTLSGLTREQYNIAKEMCDYMCPLEEDDNDRTEDNTE